MEEDSESPTANSPEAPDGGIVTFSGTRRANDRAPRTRLPDTWRRGAELLRASSSTSGPHPTDREDPREVSKRSFRRHRHSRCASAREIVTMRPWRAVYSAAGAALEGVSSTRSLSARRASSPGMGRRPRCVKSWSPRRPLLTMSVARRALVCAGLTAPCGRPSSSLTGSASVLRYSFPHSLDATT